MLCGALYTEILLGLAKPNSYISSQGQLRSSPNNQPNDQQYQMVSPTSPGTVTTTTTTTTTVQKHTSPM